MLDLYRRYLLGDRYVNVDEMKVSSSNRSLDFIITNHSQDDIKYLEILSKRINECRLCAISRMTGDKDRLAGFMAQEGITKKVAFVIENLTLTKPSNNIDNLEKNIHNDTLMHIIENVFCFNHKEVFILPLMKCVDISGSSMIKNALLGNALNNDIDICKEYLFMQLECMDYVVFFGRRLCKLVFDLSIKDAIGKLLIYKTARDRTLECVCVDDLAMIAGNASVKRDSVMNLLMLRSAMRL